MTCILSVMWAMTCSHPCFFKKIYFTKKKKKKVTLSILTTHFTTHTMYVTPIKASVNVEVAGPGPYTWAICKERKGNIG